MCPAAVAGCLLEDQAAIRVGNHPLPQVYSAEEKARITILCCSDSPLRVGVHLEPRLWKAWFSERLSPLEATIPVWVGDDNGWDPD